MIAVSNVCWRSLGTLNRIGLQAALVVAGAGIPTRLARSIQNDTLVLGIGDRGREGVRHTSTRVCERMI
jgi:hypothetical protein